MSGRGRQKPSVERLGVFSAPCEKTRTWPPERRDLADQAASHLPCHQGRDRVPAFPVPRLVYSGVPIRTPGHVLVWSPISGITLPSVHMCLCVFTCIKLNIVGWTMDRASWMSGKSLKTNDKSAVVGGGKDPASKLSRRKSAQSDAMCANRSAERICAVFRSPRCAAGHSAFRQKPPTAVDHSAS